mgnify:CR=1 FL=1
MGVAFGPDSQMLATAGSDGTVRLWNVTTGQALGDPLTGHAGGIPALAFAPDGTTLLSAGLDDVLAEQARRARAFSVLSKLVSGRQITSIVRQALKAAYNWPDE